MHPDLPLNQILIGDCRELLKTLPDESVNCVVTSPPYWGLRSYGTEPQIWANGHEPCIEHQWGTETRKVSNNNGQGGSTLNCIKPGYIPPYHEQHAGTNRVISSNTCSLCGAWRGELGLEPTPELYVAHLVEIFREVRRVLRDDGTLWLNLGDSYNSNASNQNGGGLDGSIRGGNREIGRRNKQIAGLKPKDLVGIPWMVAFALRADGWYLRSDIIWAKPNPMPESVTDRPTKAHEYIFLLSKSQRYYYDADAVREPVKEESLKRAEYSGADNTKWHDQQGVDGVKPRACLQYGPGNNPLGRNRRSVWTVATHPFKGAHFATFPPKLIEPCILAGCPVDGVVLDPFIGSGTTASVCISLKRNYIGFDLNAVYVEDIAQDRADNTPPPLFVL